jgi:hypothetical protein
MVRIEASVEMSDADALSWARIGESGERSIELSVPAIAEPEVV